MFEKETAVIYKGAGICRIADIRKERFGKAYREYYVLTPMYETVSSRFFVPVGSEAEKFKPVLTAAETDPLFAEAEALDFLWIENDKLRKRGFAEIIKEADRATVIRAVAETCIRQDERRRIKGKLRASDEQFLKDAQKIVENELAFVLKVEPENVREIIIERLAPSVK